MKKIIFLITILLSAIIPLTTNAKTEQFYASNYIPNVYFHKIKGNTKLYAQAQFIRKTSTNEPMYCIEPIILFENGSYESTINPNNLTEEQIMDISLYSHFGYGYNNQTEDKWYAATQVLIWRTIDPTMEFIITENKSPYAVKLYQTEINTIKQHATNYKKNLCFSNKKYTLVEGESLILKDTNKVLKYYKYNNKNIKQDESTIEINNLSTGNHKIIFTKEHNLYNKHPLFYTNPSNQDLLEIGDPAKSTETIEINVVNTNIEIIKEDLETVFPQGDTSFNGTEFVIRNKSHDIVKKITLEDSKINIKNLPFGEYYIQETKSTTGYNLNNENHYFTLDENNLNKLIIIKNKAIKTKLIIKKEYGTDNNFIPEKNISFNIFHKENLIKTIITNEEGIAEIDLPYGKYKIYQLTTTEGYEKIKPIEIEINNNKAITLNLKDYKINVPNTKTNIIKQILLKIINIICGKNY